MATIKSPNPKFTGVSASLHFVKGEAKTDDAWLKEWFKRRGYTVEEEQNEEPFDREAAKERLEELGVDFKGNASNEALKQLLNEHDKQDDGEGGE